MRKFFVGVVLLVSGTTAWAQPEEANSEDMIELSGFSISADSVPQMETRSVVSSKMASTVQDPRAVGVPTAPVSIFKRADAVVVQFILSNAQDKQQVRNQELYASVEAIESQVKSSEGLRMEQREVRFTGGDRKIFSGSRSGSTVSYANIVIFADLPVGVRVVDRVKQVRDALDLAKLVGQTKAQDGTVGLYLKSPDQYRREILQKIFEDLTFVGKGVGADFEVRPSGLNQRVRTRVSAESEIELWIDYSFTIQSLREIEREKPTK